MSSILVDTGPLVALADRRDNAHEECKAFLAAYRGRLVTTWAVLTEFSHLAPSVSATLPLYRWIDKGGLELLPLGRDELVRAIDWIEKYADRPMDLADASLVVAAMSTGIHTIWTLDRNDFETYRLPGRKRFRLGDPEMNLLRGPARFILKLLGWRLVDLPQRPAKAVVIAYPHTSNWDFPVTLLALAALPFGAQWVAKDTLFRGILGPIMRALGGVAVNRRERTGFVERVADEFRRRDNFHLIIATEGTRRLQAGWKSGFYRIALAAGVPVIMAVVDYGKREVGLLACITLSGDEATDMARIAVCYEGRKGYHHENASPIRLL